MKVITFGEIMMRLNPPGYLRFLQTDTYEATYAGGEANVAVSLANFRDDAAFVSNYIQNYLVTGDGGRGSGMNHSGLVWSFLVFQQWYHHFMRQEG